MPGTNQLLNVFLSHAHADVDAVRVLYNRLIADGVDVWLDRERLLPGQDWDLEIQKALSLADVVIICLSKQFARAGYRQKEVRIAINKADLQPEGDIFIIPARLGECEIPENLRKWHCVDLFELEGYERLMRTLRLQAAKNGIALQSKRSLVMSGFCLNHGPFDGTTCPYPPPHGGGRPENPPPLDEDVVINNLVNDLDDLTKNNNLSVEIPYGKRRQGLFSSDDQEESESGKSFDDAIDATELDAPFSTTQAMLWIKEGRMRGHIYPIRHGTVVGRKAADLILDDPKVSSIHAKFTIEGDEFVVWDFGSSNGTYVNGKKIREATVLDENDLVKIGDTIFVVKLLVPHLKRKETRSTPKSKFSSTRKSGIKKAKK
jgi:hypothetical protein